jgi:hypothetical protein
MGQSWANLSLKVQLQLQQHLHLITPAHLPPTHQLLTQRQKSLLRLAISHLQFQMVLMSLQMSQCLHVR